MTKKIFLFCVNHNTPRQALSYVTSVIRSLEACRSIFCDIYVLDNSDYAERSFDLESVPKSDFGRVNLFFCENLGYFPTVGNFVSKMGLDLQSADYVIISNVDLEVSSDFFGVLDGLTPREEVAVLSPSIIDESTSVNRNPKMVFRPSKLKLLLNYFFSISPYTHKIMWTIHFLRQNLRGRPDFGSSRNINNLNKTVYGTHGCFFIFTKNYFENCDINYPIFLFGEELYVAEQVRKQKMQIVFDSSLLVHDLRGASTGSLKSSKYCQLNRNAIFYVLRNFY